MSAAMDAILRAEAIQAAFGQAWTHLVERVAGLEEAVAAHPDRALYVILGLLVLTALETSCLCLGNTRWIYASVAPGGFACIGAGVGTVSAGLGDEAHLVRRIEHRVGRLTDSIGLLTDTTEACFQAVAAQLPASATAGPLTEGEGERDRELRQRRVLDAATSGQAIEDIAAREAMPETEVRLRLQLAGHGEAIAGRSETTEASRLAEREAH